MQPKVLWLVVLSLVPISHICGAFLVSTSCTNHDQFLCSNGKCIQRKFVCDGDNDCNDLSDETFCVASKCNNPAAFMCRNGACTSVAKVCDGSNNCQDGSDEENCGLGNCNHPNIFACSSGVCISKRYVCDGRRECADGSDEEQCGIGIAAVLGANTTRIRGISWLKSKRNSRWGWDDNTHRAIVALYLSGGATFDGTKEEEELMAKQLELKVALALLRNETTPLTANQMALYINALLVTCHNPRNFYGFDLVDILKQMIQFKENSTHPVVSLALCNANETVSIDAVRYLLIVLDYEPEYLFWTDIQAMAVMALSCITSKSPYAYLAPNITSTTSSFKIQQRTDGSFGNIYTSALVVQALLASGNEQEKDWDLEGAIKYLQSKQSSSDGYSFGDFLATYLVLPIMNGKSLADTAHVKCTNLRRQPRNENSVFSLKNHLGPFVHVTYSLYIGDDMRVIHPLSLKVPSNITVYDVMNLAADTDPKYKYESRRTSHGLYIYSVAGTTNDPETGMFWLMHLAKIDSKEVSLQTESPEKIHIKGGEHIIMWYKTANLQA